MTGISRKDGSALMACKTSWPGKPGKFQIAHNQVRPGRVLMHSGAAQHFKGYLTSLRHD